MFGKQITVALVARLVQTNGGEFGLCLFSRSLPARCPFAELLAVLARAFGTDNDENRSPQLVSSRGRHDREQQHTSPKRERGKSMQFRGKTSKSLACAAG